MNELREVGKDSGGLVQVMYELEEGLDGADGGCMWMEAATGKDDLLEQPMTFPASFPIDLTYQKVTT